MTDSKISPRILDLLDKKTKGDTQINTFLKDLLYEESTHRKGWRFKDPYKKRIKAYAKNWIDNDED